MAQAAAAVAQGGRPLPVAERALFEPFFGRDFSHVRIHDGPAAGSAARAIRARAYTLGSDVAFAPGEYAPRQAAGRRLLAHELTHVVQQATGKRLQRAATDPVVPVRAQITLTNGVGSGATNNVADVRLVQDRLLELRYLTAAEHTAEQPAAAATGAVPEATLTRTIAAIETFQSDVIGMASPDGAVDAGGNTLANLNRAVPRPTAAEMGSVTTERTGIVETVTRGVTLTGSVGRVPAADVTAGTANLPDDVRSVQNRLEQLGHLQSGHGEAPAAGATASIAVASLTQTIAAIRRFQRREVNYWVRRGEITGAVTDRVVTLGDATAELLDAVSSYREEFPSGEVISFRDFVRSRYTRNVRGTSLTGTAAPSALAAAEYTAIGLTPAQTNALRYVSSHEGNFDALNTYDRARVSFGFIQFAGGRGLPPFMALLKSRDAATFATMFQTYGIDVEFNVVSGRIQNATIVVLDPASGNVLRGVAAEEAIRDSSRLSAIFVRSGRNVGVQRVQVEAATRDYVLPALGRQATFEADIVEVLNAPGGTVTATHAGAAARAFRATPAYATLNGAGRINERRQASSAGLDTLLTSEQGMAVLIDRAIHEGVGTGAVRLSGAMRWVTDRRGLTDIAAVAGFEGEVLQQVVDDFTADIDIASRLDDTIGYIQTLRTAARAAGATVAGVTGQAEAASARTEVDNAIALVPRKSLAGSRTRLETHLPPQRTRLDFTPAPATPAALNTLLGDIIRELNRRKPNAGNARAKRARVQSILASALVGP